MENQCVKQSTAMFNYYLLFTQVLVIHWILEHHKCVTKQCGVFSVTNPRSTNGVLYFENNARGKISFSLNNRTCEIKTAINFEISMYNFGTQIFEPQCTIPLTVKNSCRKSTKSAKELCGCLELEWNYFFTVTVNRSMIMKVSVGDYSYQIPDLTINITSFTTEGKLTSNSPLDYTTQLIEEISFSSTETYNKMETTEGIHLITELTSLTSKEGLTSTKMKGPSSEIKDPSTNREGPSTKREGPSTKREGPSTNREGPSTKREGRSTEGKTFSMIAFNVMSTAVPKVLTSDKTEYQQIGIVLYALGCIIISIIVMATVICVIGRKLYRKVSRVRYPQLEVHEHKSRTKDPRQWNKMSSSSDFQERNIKNCADDNSDSEVTVELKIKVPMQNSHHTARRKQENQFDSIDYLTPVSDPTTRKEFDNDYQEICEDYLCRQ